MPQAVRRQGASISVIIQDFIVLLRSLVSPTPIPTRQLGVQTSSLSSEISSATAELSYSKQKSIRQMQQQQEIFAKEMTSVVNTVLDRLSSEKWADLSKTDQEIAYGLLAVIGGWTPPLRTG